MAWHNLSGNKCTTQPTQMIVFDTETVPAARRDRADHYAHHFRLGHAIFWRWGSGKQSRREELAFTDTNVFWQWLARHLDQRRTTLIWSHNLGFDLTVARFWERMEAKEYTREEPAARYRARAKAKGPHRKVDGFICTEDPPIILKLWHASHARSTFLDTLNFWKTSLANLGRAIGRDKMPLPDWSESDEAWAEYCHNDAVILEMAVLALLRFVKELDLGKLRYTAPAQAMSAYRHRFLTTKIVIHDDKAARKLERDSYFNGRCEAYFRGRVRGDNPDDWWGNDKPDVKPVPTLPPPVYHLDVSAMYPAIMAAKYYPRKMVAHLEGRPDMLALLPVPPHACIARVGLDTPRPFPVRIAGKGTTYAVGRFTTTLVGPELSEAVLGGFVKTWEEVTCYDLVDLFSPWVGEFWQRRIDFEKAGKPEYAELCKLFMNSLYGKFGQKTPEWNERPDLDFDEPWGLFTATTYPDQSTYPALAEERLKIDPDFQIGQPLVANVRIIGHSVQEMKRRVDADDCFTAISSFVTSYGRVFMDSLRRTAGYSQVYYQGVDSLHVSERGYDRLRNAGLLRPRTLGYLRLLDTYRDCRYYGPMDYTADGRIVRAGRKDKGHAVGNDVWQQQTFQGVNSVLQDRPTGVIEERPRQLTHRPIKPDVTVDDFGWMQPVRL